MRFLILKLQNDFLCPSHRLIKEWKVHRCYLWEDLVLTFYLRRLSFYVSVEVSVNENISIKSISLALNKTLKFSLSPLESNLEHADT